MNPEAFLELFRAERASAILRTSIPDAVAPAMEAAVQGGFRVIEFTLTCPDVLRHIEDFSKRDGLVVGAGTVLTIEQARQAVKAGASFLVSPVVDEEIIAEAGRLGVAMIPGTHTPTEMLRAHRAGAQLQKLFPAPGIGAAFVKATLGPMPFLNIVPTSGVDETNVSEYLDAGAFAAGFVAPLFIPEALARGDFEVIRKRAELLLQAVAPGSSGSSGDQEISVSFGSAHR